MVKRLIIAAIAAFFMLPVFGLTAFAAGLDEATPTPVVTEVAAVNPAPEIPDAAQTPDTPGITPAPTPEAAPAETPQIAEDHGAVSLPAVPPGVGTVIDYNTDPDGRLFYTIMTPDKQVFYLVIDKNSSTDNVYFLNAVTIADLAALAEMPASTQNGAVTPPPSATVAPAQPSETPPPAAQPKQGGGNMGMYIIVGLIVIAAGGAGWYFKIYRPKQQGAANGDEYDPTANEQENDYAADWDENPDESDDSPPWDEDAPVEDEAPDDGESGGDE